MYKKTGLPLLIPVDYREIGLPLLIPVDYREIGLPLLIPEIYKGKYIEKHVHLLWYLKTIKLKSNLSLCRIEG
jgi:hypothetical protein